MTETRDSLSNGSNAHRIRNLEATVDELVRTVDQLRARLANRAIRNPIAKLVQIPEDGFEGRESTSDKAIEKELSVVRTDHEGTIYLTVERLKVRNVSTTAFNDAGSRLAWALQHDDGYWILHAFDCNDEGDSAIAELP